jgi:hypothetical protein
MDSLFSQITALVEANVTELGGACFSPVTQMLHPVMLTAAAPPSAGTQMKWFKLHTEARNDAKLRSMSDSQHRVWFNLLPPKKGGPICSRKLPHLEVA